MNKKNCKQKFTVIMSVYKNEKPYYLDLSLYSVFNQTIEPDEVILIIDGPIGEALSTVVSKYESKYSALHVVKLKANGGLGKALRLAVEKSKNDIIFRMDTDDICFHDRFEIQLSYFLNNSCDVLGGQVVCFSKDPRSEALLKGIYPTESESIRENIWKANPFAHPSVVFRKGAVLKAGNYEDLYLHEDYYLWARMLKNGCVFRNMEACVLFFRVNPKQSKRRGGKKNFEAEKKVQRYLYDNRLISKWEIIKALFIKFNYHILVPGFVKYKLCRMIRWKNLVLDDQKRVEKELEFLDRNAANLCDIH